MAFGGPGIEPRWTRSAKDAVGTAYSASSRVWFTLSRGILNEVYYPKLDQPQIRDLQFMVSDGETFFQDEQQLDSQIKCLSTHALGFCVTNSDPQGRYQLIKEIISDPHQPCVLVHTRLKARPKVFKKLQLFVLCAPHLDGGGWGNNGEVVLISGEKILVAHKNNTWLALKASSRFSKCSCGYVGVNDGWQDLNDNYKLDWEFDTALDGNIALTGQIDLTQGNTLTLGLAFGDTCHGAITALYQSLGIPFAQHRRRFVEQWRRGCKHVLPLERSAGDGGRLYHASQSLLLSHEDKTYPGAMIASLSIPWGEARGDEALGGYHLVWTRDMVNSSMGLLAAENTAMPLRALIYLATSQLPDGGFYQNFWLDGEPYWEGVQLDEVAFPILLAWRLHQLFDALQDFDPYPMVLRAASYLIRQGPVTPQERWEEASGYSPSTLASNIAALTCAACFAREHEDEETADFIQEYADFLESHVERWTVTSEGTLVPGVARHYIRIHPVSVHDVQPDEDPNHGTLRIANRAPGQTYEFPAKEVVDAGFLELVRYGIRRASDPLVEDSLRVVDALLKVKTPLGDCWRRYNHDGYGQRANGAPYEYWGVGRAWPLLTGERGHYELAAGRDTGPYLSALEKFAHAIGLLTEQVWDKPDLPKAHMVLGRPTGSVMPLMWAHAEYIKLLRSVHDGQVFDLIPQVAERYLGDHKLCKTLEIWKPNRQVRCVESGTTLRIQAPQAFELRWTNDGWKNVNETRSNSTKLDLSFVDISVPEAQRAPLQFTFYWSDDQRWGGQNYTVEVLE